MKVDIYVHGNGSIHLAKYLSNVLGIKYDTDGENIFVFNGIESDKIPEAVFRRKIADRLQIRTAEGSKRGDFVWPKGFTYA